MSETHEFKAEVNQLLQLVINSLYTNREIFLRELISNASDALDRLSFRSLTEHELLAEDAAMEIRLVPDADAGTLTIVDTGIGMTREELVADLGTIAHSGTRAYLEQLGEGEGAEQHSRTLIGQFGVGFYSAYLVAQRVEVVSRPPGEDAAAWRWVSAADGEFSVEPAEAAHRGTVVTLHLREDQGEYLEPLRLRELVRRYSDFVSYPIKLRVEDDWETVNRASALWRRPRSEITDQEYEEFYKHLSHDHEAPLARTHFTMEGRQSFTGLLFVPRHPPFDLLLGRPESRGVRLFARRVFVMDRCEEIVPEWLRFLRGVVDSDDLDLNISRETLQDSSLIRTIRTHVIKQSLDLLEGLEAEDYQVFWQHFGAILKEGLVLAGEHRERLGTLLRFSSSHGEELTSLPDYVDRMREGQDSIYYAIGTSVEQLSRSPHLEGLLAEGYEVLYLTDPVDDWAVRGLQEFDGKPLVSAMQAGLEVARQETGSEEAEPADAAPGEAPGQVLELFRAVLGERIAEVRSSTRLRESPCCLVVPEGGLHPQTERLMRLHDRELPETRRILEVNPGHALIASLARLHATSPDRPELRDWVELLYDLALLDEGGRPADQGRFAARLTGLLERAASQADGEVGELAGGGA